jgi:hypothetical protein
MLAKKGPRKITGGKEYIPAAARAKTARISQYLIKNTLLSSGIDKSLFFIMVFMHSIYVFLGIYVFLAKIIFKNRYISYCSGASF